MNDQVARVIAKSPYNFRSKRIYSDNERTNSMQVDYHNRESEDYSEPQSKKSGNVLIANPIKRSLIKKNFYREDRRYKNASSDKNELVQTSNNFKQFKEQIKNRISQIPMQPQKPKLVKERMTSREQDSEDIISSSGHMGSRIETQNMTVKNQAQKQILIGFDTNLYTEAHKILEQLQQQIFQKNTSPLIRKYLQIIATGALDDYSNINLNLHKRKIIKLAILYERISVLLVAFSEITQNITIHQNYLSNILKYVLDNRILVLSILQGRLEKLEIQKTFISTETGKLHKQSRNFEILRDNNEIILQIIYKLSTEDNYFFENLRKFIKGSSTYTIQQCFYFILEYFAFFLHLSGLQDKIPFLSVAPNPYLPPAQKYTLVFDFVEVMYNQKHNCFRPHTQQFLQQMSQLYQLVSYSAVYPKQIQQILKYVDKKNKISHKLYKHHFVKCKNKLQKDLSRLGRPLSMVILLDVQDSYLNPKNTFKVKRWTGGNKDTTLSSISQLLASIVVQKLNVEEQIQRYKHDLQIKRNMKNKLINYGIRPQ